MKIEVKSEENTRKGGRKKKSPKRGIRRKQKGRLSTEEES